ncbi:HlyD family type I secretion periplasmic adaptor subunit [Teredinibacter waterburyi]|uniref:HlyD family type I secretion periplasmic adaptor subunit n=1 Tax=Teredinibacter waterburyi TaxID=1500538 RepID=UPI00165FCC4E|nr:HlyD family type I secretion periplasmic adaptor subunit [Teredinibacter waterburyi]
MAAVNNEPAPQADASASAVGSTTLQSGDLNYVSSAQAALLEQSPRGGQYLIWAVAGFVLLFLVWASVAELDEFTRGEGKIIPSQSIQLIQNLEGGILAQLFVSEGDVVARGQKLLRIDDTQFSSSLREAGLTQGQLEIKAERLRAETLGSEFTVPPDSRFDPKLVQQELAVYKSRLREFESANAVLMQQMAQRKQEVSELEAKYARLARSYELLRTELELTQPLAADGAISQVELLRLERQVNDLQGEMRAAQLALPRAKSSLSEIKERLESQMLTFRRDAREQLNEVTNELSLLRSTSEALVDRVQRTLVVSPVAGTVKRLLVRTIGGVIQPGMDIVEVVPSEEILLIEARVRPADIAFLHPGQKAKVKFTAYDFAIMGGLDGNVVHISPDTIVNDQGESFYSVKVETNKVFIGPDGSELPIIPGMTVNVDILTGHKTIMDYLLKPILKTKHLALRER